MNRLPWRYLAILLAANLVLLLPNAAPLRVTGALLLIGLLPGLSWANRLLTTSSPLLRWTTAAALAYTLSMLTTLLLHYMPGPTQTWQLLTILNLVALIPLWPNPQADDAESSPAILRPAILRPAILRLCPPPLLLILLIALLLRGLNLHYSEFQGDEALAMISAAEALEGHDDALFIRSKGPGEVLLPMALWQLIGVINEPIARLPFTAAGLLAIVTIYLIGQELGGQRVGWLAAGFFAFNGFTVAFGRIVQYQALVLWLSALAFLLVLKWRQTDQQRFAILGGLCLGAGLLAHYDAILVLPAIAWLFISGLTASRQTVDSRQQTTVTNQNNTFLFSGQPPALSLPNGSVGSRLIASLKSGLLFLMAFLLIALPFYLPYALDPQANRTGDYVGQRIGRELRNNLPDFFHFNTFYSSAYYIILTSLLVLVILLWFMWQACRRRWWVAVLLAIIIGAVIFSPDLLAREKLNLSILPFALLFVEAFFARPFGNNDQAVIVWLAVPFLGYNFVVALGLTHIYTIVPAWSLLAALAWHQFTISKSQIPNEHEVRPQKPHFPFRLSNFSFLLSNFVLGGLLILSTIFLGNAFVRNDVEYWQDYPNGNLPLYWNPYEVLPQAGFFGFAHRTGWKVVGQKIVTGELTGDYGSNEEVAVTAWYTRGTPRACDAQPEFYFLADDLIDPVEIPDEVIDSQYKKIGSVTLANQKQMQIMQQIPSTLTLGELDETRLAREFDQAASPAAFARSARGAIPLAVNFDNLVQLIGYDLDARRASPGGRLPVTLYWQALAPIPASYQVFTHLESDTGPVAQADGVPVCWNYPTDLWQPGQIIADQHAILIPSDLPPGDYPLEVGLYLADTFERLDVLDEAGNPAGTSVTLDTVEIKNQ
jgi:hypothetical protein